MTDVSCRPWPVAALLAFALAGCSSVAHPALDVPPDSTVPVDAPGDLVGETFGNIDAVPPADLTSDFSPDAQAPRPFLVVTFNTGISMAPDGSPGSMTPAQAEEADKLYGNGLAWLPAVDAARIFLAAFDPDVVVFQEIFPSESCVDIPVEARPGFVCETWQPGEPIVAQAVLGPGWQVACNWLKHDKCAGVNRRFGTFRGCDGDLCLDGLAGSTIEGCGKGARVGRGVIDLVGGGALNLVNVHGSSGIAAGDQDCRGKQFRQIFVDLGDGAPAANGVRNLVLGDFNTDPARLAEGDPSAAYLASQVGPGTRFHFLTDADPDGLPTYGGFVTIDHVIADFLDGTCWTAGVTEGAPAAPGPWFDHHPTACTVVPTQ